MGHWCWVVLINVNTSTENKANVIKDEFYMELENLFDYFQKYDMKITLYFNTKIGRKEIFRPMT